MASTSQAVAEAVAMQWRQANSGQRQTAMPSYRMASDGGAGGGWRHNQQRARVHGRAELPATMRKLNTQGGMCSAVQ
jgi:hypothetical protein